jgi:oxaloacetate decarboxylase alpha subunit
MTTEEMLPIAEKMDQVGYWSMEVWGGATFDAPLRFLNEDPWERLFELRKRIKKTKLQMLLRGQNIVGYRNYPDDLLEAFIEKAAEGGIDVFRIFDALNDVRNLSQSIKFVKKAGKHAQGTICYTISPVHTIEYYVECVRQQVEEGIDSICIKDMAGILAPDVAYDLVVALKEFKIPIHLHCHSASGMAVAAYMKALEAGVDIIDCAHSPLAFYTSQPAIETIVAMLQQTEYDPGLNLKLIEEVSQYFEEVRKKRDIKWDTVIDSLVITHQVPGGMASNLISQLKEQRSLDRLPEVLAEVPKVREDLGYPPLVTPTSQIVGVQAVFNVLTGERYKIVPQEVKDYVKGFYGRSPGKIKEDIRKKIIGDEKMITTRPADLLEPVMEKAKKELPAEFVEKEEDIITYALFPETALKFFQFRKDPRAPKPEPKPKEAVSEKAATTEEASTNEAKMIRELIEIVGQHDITELEWEQAGTKIRIKRGFSITLSHSQQIHKPQR